MSRPFILPMLAMLAAGCARPGADRAYSETKIVFGDSVRGRPIEATILGDGPDTALVLASIHGNETAGTPLARELIRVLRRRHFILEGRRVIVVPVVNPDGVAAGTRFNARGVDLNRNFAAANRVNNSRNGEAALTEPESRALERLIRQFRPDRIVTIHQPLSVVDHDGLGDDLARRMALYTPLPARRIGSRPGSLGSFAGATLGIPIVTYELPAGAESLDIDRLWQTYGRALLAAITFPEFIP